MRQPSPRVATILDEPGWWHEPPTTNQGETNDSKIWIAGRNSRGGVCGVVVATPGLRCARHERVEPGRNDLQQRAVRDLSDRFQLPTPGSRFSVEGRFGSCVSEVGS